MFDNEKKIKKIERELKYNEIEYKKSQQFRNNINQNHFIFTKSRNEIQMSMLLIFWYKAYLFFI